MTASKQRCLIIGNHPMILDGLCYVLQPEFEAIAVAANVDVVLPAMAAFRPDAAVIDLEPSHGAFEMGRRLREAHPGLAVTYLTAEVAASWGGNVVSKTRPASEFVQAVRKALSGSDVGSTGAARQTLEPMQGKTRVSVKLSDRERQVLTLLVRGQSMKQVARALGVAPRTVAFHKYKAMAANGLTNNAELLNFALHQGLLFSAHQDQAPTMQTSVFRGLRPTLLTAIVCAAAQEPGIVMPITSLLV